MLRVRGAFILVVVSIALTILFLGLTQSPTPIVGVYYYPWYSSEGRHWSDNPVTPVIETPVIGFYDSRDESVITWQLKLIKDAGIDFIIVSWWGPGSYEDNATKTVARYVREYGLKFTILVEPYFGGNPSLYNRSFWESTLDYLKSNFIEPYRDVYFHLHGRPLILAFNPIGLSYRPRDDFPDYTIRIVGNDIDNAKYQEWDYWPDYLLNSPSVELRIRKDGMVSIIPRFCDKHFRTPGTCVDPDLSQQLYKKQWSWVLKNADKISILVITSWNEYHERTQIEPSFSEETRDPWVLYDLTRGYIALLKSGTTGASLSIPLLRFTSGAFVLKLFLCIAVVLIAFMAIPPGL